MAMLQLNQLLPADENEPFWVFSSKEYTELLATNDTYIIIECYCDNPSCECESLIAAITSLNDNNVPAKKASAIIHYDWSTKKTRCKPTLHEDSPRTALAQNLLAIYKDFIHSEDYLTRIKNQYAKVKQLAAERNNKNKINNANKNVGRNDPCVCGSGKKFKKCCLNTEDLSEVR